MFLVCLVATLQFSNEQPLMEFWSPGVKDHVQQQCHSGVNYGWTLVASIPDHKQTKLNHYSCQCYATRLIHEAIHSIVKWVQPDVKGQRVSLVQLRNVANYKMRLWIISSEFSPWSSPESTCRLCNVHMMSWFWLILQSSWIWGTVNQLGVHEQLSEQWHQQKALNQQKVTAVVHVLPSVYYLSVALLWFICQGNAGATEAIEIGSIWQPVSGTVTVWWPVPLIVSASAHNSILCMSTYDHFLLAFFYITGLCNSKGHKKIAT